MMPSRSTVLIIDDDQDMRWALRTILGALDFDVKEAGEGARGLEVAAQTMPAAVLLDLKMPGLSGEDVLQRLRRRHKSIPVIVMTGYGSISGAIDAIRAGAFDYLTKPFDNAAVVAAVERAVAQRCACEPKGASSLRHAVSSMMGRSAAVENLVEKIEAVINTDYSVLITGETGTGKEIVAQALHRHGSRADKPFVVVDCGAVVETLVDSELFGHERGAYTGASERRLGRLELAANGGTLFLDEIGNLCPVGQRALLRALEDRVIYRVGGTTPIRLNTRVIAATNDDLQDEEGRAPFRSDLFYRLAEFTIVVPPLRARTEDIEFLARRFLEETSKMLGGQVPRLLPDALDLLRSHAWPGNVRELRNVVRRAALAASTVITAEHIEAHFKCRPVATAGAVPRPAEAEAPLRRMVQHRVRQLERNAILDALKDAGGNKAQAARQLGIDYKTFRVKLKAIETQAPLGNGHEHV